MDILLILAIMVQVACYRVHEARTITLRNTIVETTVLSVSSPSPIDEYEIVTKESMLYVRKYDR